MDIVKKLMFSVILIYTFYTALVGCATLKDIGRTANDAARILCELVASEQKESLNGLSPKEWCDIQKNLDPFISEVLSAKQRSEDKLGFSREQ
jgi:hypothetical protein